MLLSKPAIRCVKIKQERVAAQMGLLDHICANTYRESNENAGQA